MRILGRSPRISSTLRGTAMQTEWIGCRPRPRRLWRGARPTRRSTTCDGRWRNPYPGEATPGAARLGAAEATANDPAAEATLDRARRLATDPALKRVVTLNLGGVLIASGRYDQAMDALIEELEQVGDDHTGLTAALETLVLATAATTPDRPLSVRAQRIRAAEVDGLAPEIARMRLRPLEVRAVLRGQGRGGRGPGRPGRWATAGSSASISPSAPSVLGVWHRPSSGSSTARALPRRRDRPGEEGAPGPGHSRRRSPGER